MSGQKREKVICRGLMTNANELTVQDGGMRTFTNLHLTRPNLPQSRRGSTRHGANSAAVSKIFNYDSGLVFHQNPSSLKRISQSTGTITAYSPGYNIVPAETTHRLRCCIAGKNLYIAGATVSRLSGLTGTPVVAGGLYSPGFDREAITYPAAGSLLATVHGAAYRALFGLTDAKGNLHLGEPSGRLLAINTTGGTTNVTLRILVPTGATANHFVQLFRSAIVTADASDGLYKADDDLRLVFEQQLKAVDLTNGYVDITDIVPDNLRGEFLYTSPNAGEGIDQANRAPPQCAEVCSHKNRMWFGNTTQPGEFFLQILAVGGTAGIQDTDKLTFGGLVSGFSLTATTGALAAGKYSLVTGGTVSANIEATALNLVSAFNKYASNTELWAEYASKPDEVPGLILFRGRAFSATQFTVQSGVTALRDCFTPQLIPDLSGVSWSLQRVSNVVTATINTGTHTLKVGEQVILANGSGTFTSTTYTITAVTGTTFTYSHTAANAGPTAGFVFSVTPTDASLSEVETLPNRAYYSKLQEYEAVPRNNWVDVGSPDAKILAMLSQRGQIWVWKEDGIYRILGDGPESFRAESLDTSIRCRATESVVLFSNRCWGLTDRGVIAVDESGLEVMSDNIAADVRSALVTYSSQLESDCFAVAYESEHLYTLWVPDDRDAQSVVGACKTAYVFQNQTKTWSKWSMGAGNGKRCGVVCITDDRLYTGDQYAGLLTDSYIYKERKALTSADFSDAFGDGTTGAIAHTATWVLATADAPASEKRWDEVQLFFVTGRVAFSYSLTNDIGGSESGSVAVQAEQTAEIWPGADVSRGQRLVVAVTHSVENEAFPIAGMAVSSEVLDARQAR